MNVQTSTTLCVQAIVRSKVDNRKASTSSWVGIHTSGWCYEQQLGSEVDRYLTVAGLKRGAQTGWHECEIMDNCGCIKSAQEWATRVRACNSNRSPESERNIPPVLKIEHWSPRLATLTFYTACAVRVTIFSTGGKFHPVSMFTRSYSSCLFLWYITLRCPATPIASMQF